MLARQSQYSLLVSSCSLLSETAYILSLEIQTLQSCTEPKRRKRSRLLFPEGYTQPLKDTRTKYPLS